MVNTRGYKNAPPQQIFKAVAEATNLLRNSRCILCAFWMGAWDRNNMEMAKGVGHCLSGFLLYTVGIQTLESPWAEAYKAEWLPGFSARLRPTTTNAVRVSSYSLKGANRGSAWQGHCSHPCIWREAGRQNISLGPGQPSLVWGISIMHLLPSRGSRSPFQLIPLIAPFPGLLPVSLPDVLP